jgi:hypothetical protein
MALELFARHPFPFGGGLHNLGIQGIRNVELGRRARAVTVEQVVDAAFPIDNPRHLDHHEAEFLRSMVFDVTAQTKDGVLRFFGGSSGVVIAGEKLWSSS